MANELSLEEWRSLIDHWIGQKRNIMHLEIPLEVADQLRIKLSEEDMARRNARKAAQNIQTPMEVSLQLEAAGVETPAAEGETPSWKRKAYFDGESCGLSGCSRRAAGYIAGTKPTGKDKKKVWFGPVCDSCPPKWNPAVRPYRLAELLINRSESELALLLDIEVGELKKRLAKDGPLSSMPPVQGGTEYDEQRLRGRATGVGQAVATAIAIVEHVTPGELVLTIDAVRIPTALIQQAKTWASSWRAYMKGAQLNSQSDLDQAGTFLKQLKGYAKTMDEERLKLGAPLREKLDKIQEAFKEGLGELTQLEIETKAVIATGVARAKQMVEASFQAAQQAYHQGNVPAVAQATQTASHFDFRMPQGIRSRPVTKWRIDNAALIPAELWSSYPDSNKIQAAVDLGHKYIPGCTIWEEDQVASTSIR